ncbi:hypothetical protein CC53_gp031 [Rhizobium phage vB_RleS_L338C]|uniref:hypothetical protein n=1 Tax=Rhizobium phage vB_RleS_L338C TaxID=1414737 RepID=UPI0003D8FDDF|nr:hypothetical protein CC53_gp031 [Rhizobium phage vB_RleS_L338C]AHC30448.1 hypothetical protein L338C_031 [Rhizobium phage vB_RleS_L338C]QNH72112.1 hypothetical protein P11VFA_109 [Rhizobium phage P11VFA]
MAIIGMDLSTEKTFVFSGDPDKGTDKATKFRYSTLDSRILGILQDKATSVKVNPSAPDEDVDTQINSKAFQFEVVQFGCKGWDNLKDGKGNDIEYETIKLNRGGKSYRVVDPDTLARVPRIVLEEFAEKIMSANELTEDEGNA